MPWQRTVGDVAGEVDEQGVPVYREVRVTVPRQSGKTTMVLVVESDRCIAWGDGQHCLYAAQDRIRSREKWEEHTEILRKTALKRAFRVRRQTGLEAMLWAATGSSMGITASGETSGHGTTLDCGIIDEAWAQRDERLAQAFRPAMMTRPAAQLWIFSTMGTQDSTFLHDRVDDGRARVEAGERSGVAYFEWSASDDDDPDDPATWWNCMPALGYTVTEAVVQIDHDGLDADEFARAYLNRRTFGGTPVISLAVWNGLVDSRSQLRGVPAFAIDVTPDREWGSIAAAGWRPDRRVHVEIVEHRQGTDWIPGRVAELYRRWSPWPVLVDPSSAAGSLLVDLAALNVATETIGGREYAQSCGAFFDAVMGGQVMHLEQPVLLGALTSARKRVLADAWAWARRSGGDVSPLVAVTLARYGLVKAGGDGRIQVL
jgi:hypothetical protein